MRWLDRLLGREDPDVHTSLEDSAELARAEYEADLLRGEAEQLRDEAQCNADLLRQSRSDDRYIEIIDALFRGEAHAHD